MDEREYFIPLPDEASLRVCFIKDRGRILRFVVQLEAYIDGYWHGITRYDNAHRFVHRDDLKPDGSQIKSPPMAFVNNELDTGVFSFCHEFTRISQKTR